MKHYLTFFPMPVLFIGFSILIAPNVMLKSSCACDYQFTLYTQPQSSPNPVGSGARAIGMGGAFIAVADDATAASWNPGGLFQLKLPETSYVCSAFHRVEDNVFDESPESSGIQSVSGSNINYLSAAYPFNYWGRNMIISVNYQHLYDFSREWNLPITLESEETSVVYTLDYQQEGSLSAFGIAYCIQIIPRFSFGFTLNLWEDTLSKNEWEEKTYERGMFDEYEFELYRYDRYALSGFNFNLGILWRSFNDRLSIGAVLKSPFSADLKHEYTYSSVQPGQEIPISVSCMKHEKMDMPISYGLGVTYRFSDEFMAAMDVYRTEWDDFIRTDAEGRETSPVTGLSPAESDIDPTHQVRMGAEYLFIKPTYMVSLCGGLFYDPAPAMGEPDDYFGFSIGSGFQTGQWNVDIAYQYRFGNRVGASVMQSLKFSQDVHEHTVYSSVIFHF